MKTKKQSSWSWGWPLGFLLWLATELGISFVMTEAVAYHFRFNEALGEPYFAHIYPPLAWLTWQAHYYTFAPTLFDYLYIISLLSFAIGLLALVLVLGFQKRSAIQHDDVHGTAHFASEEEILKTGALPRPGESGKGVYIGGWQNDKGQLRYLRHNGPEHIAVLAPTRSGKGVGLVVPTMLSWPHSAIIHDIKGELWAMTAGWRQKEANNLVLRFDPAAEQGSVRYNPLAEVRVGTPYEVGDAQNIVTMIVDPDGKGMADHWAKTAYAFLTGAVLHLLYTTRDASHGTKVANLAMLAQSLSDPNRPIDMLYQEMLNNKHQDGKTHPVVAAAGRDMLNRPEAERGSVLSSAMSYLPLYRDPIVAKNTEASDFCIRDLMHHDKPISLYLVVRPGDKDRLKPLIRLMVNQVVRVLVRDEIQFEHGQPVSHYKHRLLLMLDEFPSLGRLEIFQEALAYIAGYGIKAYLIMQDVSQLWSAYGREESILSNCHIRIAYAPNKVETAEWLSKTLGTTTIVKEEISTSGARFGAVLQQVSRSYRDISRPLMTPDECMRLRAPIKSQDGTKIIEAGDVLVFISGHAPILGTQSLYFLDSTFSKRASIEAPPTDYVQASTLSLSIKPFEFESVHEE
jgi:type IV secretion system protein VirD4